MTERLDSQSPADKPSEPCHLCGGTGKVIERGSTDGNEWTYACHHNGTIAPINPWQKGGPGQGMLGVNVTVSYGESVARSAGTRIDEAMNILIEMHRLMDFEEEVAADSDCVSDPSAINAVFARAYALINGAPRSASAPLVHPMAQWWRDRFDDIADDAATLLKGDVPGHLQPGILGIKEVATQMRDSMDGAMKATKAPADSRATPK